MQCSISRGSRPLRLSPFCGPYEEKHVLDFSSELGAGVAESLRSPPPPPPPPPQQSPHSPITAAPPDTPESHPCSQAGLRTTFVQPAWDYGFSLGGAWGALV